MTTHEWCIKYNFAALLNLYVSLKKNYLIANHSKFITKELSKKIMQSFKLLNKFFGDKTDEARAK